MEAPPKTTLPKRAWLPFAWIIAASALAHLWCLGSVFFLDDGMCILKNEYILSGQFWKAGPQAWTTLIYILENRIFGMSAPGFHAVNWLIHTAAACALFALGREFLGDRERWRVALFGALLFAVHPLGSEIPNYARTQDLAWVTLFSLLATWTFLRFLREGGWLKLPLCLLFVAGAALSKGPGVWHALMMIGAVGLASTTPSQWAAIRRYRWHLAGAVVLVAAAVWIFDGLHIFRGGMRMWSDPRIVGHGYTLSRVFWEFAWRSVIPVSLSADHHIAETMIPAGAKFWQIPDTGAMWAAVAFLAITAFSLFLAWRKSTRIVGVCLFLYIASILFRVLFLIPEFMPEYRIYPGLPWFCLGAAVVLHAGIRKLTEIPPRVPAMIVLAVFIFLSARRSFVWHDLDRLLADVLKQYPTQARAIWELHDRDIAAKNWQAVIDRQQKVWPEVARRFHAENKRLAPGRELPTGHFALAEIACAGDYALAIASKVNPAAGLREMNALEIYMRRLGLDPVAHSVHWSYFFYDKALILEMAGNDQAALELLRKEGLPDWGGLTRKRVEKKLADKAAGNG